MLYNPGMDDQPTQPSPAKPTPSLIDIINVLADRVDPLLKVLSTTMQQRQSAQEHEARFQTRMAGYAILVVVVVVGVAGYLTAKGKVDGSTFTFLLGLIVGYVLTFVRDQITGPDE
jgi:hypothetical protein